MIIQETCIKHFFVLLFFLVVACKGENGPVQSDTDPTEPAPVQPVSITPQEVLFTNPDEIANGEPSRVIMDRLIELIDAVPVDASIYMSIYLFEYDHLIDALKRAHSRNVRLNIMVDMSDRSQNEPAVWELTDLGMDDYLTIVRVYNDAGSLAINHNKFVLFSEVMTENGALEHLVFQTSQNFINAGMYKIQDAVSLAGEHLYQAYFEYWEDMRALASEGMENYEYREFHDPENGITAYFFPKRKAGSAYGNDTFIEILDDITDPSSATIKIGMSSWTDSRPNIVEKLNELMKQGATIEVITKNSIDQGVFNSLRGLEQNGANVVIYNLTDSERTQINIHVKFMLIEGIWRNTESKVLITGSQNFTNNALRNNNEVTLLFQDHKFYDIYDVYFEKIQDLPEKVCCSVEE